MDRIKVSLVQEANMHLQLMDSYREAGEEESVLKVVDDEEGE